MRQPLFAGLLLAILLAAGAAAAAEKFDPAKEKEAVIKAIHGSIEWCFPDKSRERLYGSAVQDSTYFMFQPDSRSTIIGFDAFRDFAERVFMVDECKPIGTKISELRVSLSASGDVAWFSCMLEDWGEWGDRTWHWKDARWTGVLRKIDGKWLMAQQHFSLAEDKVQAELMAEIEAAKEKP